MGSCFSNWFQDCSRGQFHGWEVNEVPATMGPLHEPAAEKCPYCSGIVRNAHQIWLDELEEKVLNARCVSRIIEADNKKDQLLQKYKIGDMGNNVPAFNNRATPKVMHLKPGGSGDAKIKY